MSTTSNSTAIGRRRSLSLSFRSCVDLLNVWVYRATERRAVSKLSDLVLRDIGLTWADVMQESMKPFWQD